MIYFKYQYQRFLLRNHSYPSYKVPKGVITPVGAFLFAKVSPRHGGLKYIILRAIPRKG
jgi:hypothetical protein